LGILGGPASLVILFGMAIYCIREDDSSTGNKIFWFAVFFITAPFGAAAYFFGVYQKQVRAQGYAPVAARSAGRAPRGHL
jgi:multisubunit Na+/H+ antiporter MnhG subunit